jgi:hypothetical protein
MNVSPFFHTYAWISPTLQSFIHDDLLNHVLIQLGILCIVGRVEHLLNDL